MTDSIIALHPGQSPFDQIRRFDQDGSEFWMARDLMKLLGYIKWQKFKPLVDQAIENVELSGGNGSEHALPVRVSIRGQNALDFKLTRLGAYHVALACTGKGKPLVAQAKQYFAAKTREAEVKIPTLETEVLRLQIELKQAEAQAAIAQTNLLDKRHAITQLCPEAIQQKVLGYQVVEKVEYRDRILHNDDLINDGSTIGKGELCRHFGLVTRTGKPNYKALNGVLSQLPSEAFDLSAQIIEHQQLRREWLPTLAQLVSDATRQTWLGEN